MIFVFDIDDTISKTGEYGKEYMIKHFKDNNLSYKPRDEICKYPEDQFVWTHEEANKWYKENGDKMLLSFPCFDGAVDTINKLYEAGHEVIFATARSTDWYVTPIETTIKWLKKNNIKYNKLYTGRVDKEKICEIENANVFVDDNLDTCLRVAEYFKGTKNRVFLMSAGNEEVRDLPENITKIDFVKEILQIMKLDV